MQVWWWTKRISIILPFYCLVGADQLGWSRRRRRRRRSTSRSCSNSSRRRTSATTALTLLVAAERPQRQQQRHRGRRLDRRKRLRRKRLRPQQSRHQTAAAARARQGWRRPARNGAFGERAAGTRSGWLFLSFFPFLSTQNNSTLKHKYVDIGPLMSTSVSLHQYFEIPMILWNHNNNGSRFLFGFFIFQEKNRRSLIFERICRRKLGFFSNS